MNISENLVINIVSLHVCTNYQSKYQLKVVYSDNHLPYNTAQTDVLCILNDTVKMEIVQEMCIWLWGSGRLSIS